MDKTYIYKKRKARQRSLTAVIRLSRADALTLSYTGLPGGKTASTLEERNFTLKLPTALF